MFVEEERFNLYLWAHEETVDENDGPLGSNNWHKKVSLLSMIMKSMKSLFRDKMTLTSVELTSHLTPKKGSRLL